MRAMAVTFVVLLAGRLAAPSDAAGQHRERIYHRLTDAVLVGGTLAANGSGTERLAGGPEATALLELPIGDILQLRLEGGVGFWHYNGEPFYGVPGSAMRRYRLSGTVIRGEAPAAYRRLRGYAGAGGGLYFHRFPSRPNAGAWGIHGVAGTDYLLPTMRSRWVVGAELQLHALGQPKGVGEVTSMTMLAAHAAVLVKYRLP